MLAKKRIQIQHSTTHLHQQVAESRIQQRSLAIHTRINEIHKQKVNQHHLHQKGKNQS